MAARKLRAYEVNNVLRLRFSFEDSRGRLVDPQNISVAVSRTGVAQDLEFVYDVNGTQDLVRLYKGVYELQLPVDTTGVWEIVVTSLPAPNRGAARRVFSVVEGK